MTNHQSIALLGLRGSGKSSVGPKLAERLGLPFVDLDPLTLQRAGTPDVRSFVEHAGWNAFREQEREALGRALGGPPCVLGLGGGTPTHQPSRELLVTAADAGSLCLVYLRARPETLAARMQLTPDRPSLTGSDPFDEIAAIFEARDPVYLELAHHVVETDGLTLDQSVDLAAAAV